MLGGIKLLSTLYQFCNGDYGLKAYVLLCKNLVIYYYYYYYYLCLLAIPFLSQGFGWYELALVAGRAHGSWRGAVFPLEGKTMPIAKAKCVWRKITPGGEKLSTEVLSMISIISFLWCPADGDKDLSFIDTCRRQHPRLQPGQNSWQIFHFLLFIVFTKSPCSLWSRCKWKVKACDTENWGSLSGTRCDKAFPSFKMHKVSGRALCRAVGCGVLLLPTCRDPPGNIEKTPRVVGLFVSTKAWCVS